MSPQTQRRQPALTRLGERWTRYFLHLYQRPAVTLGAFFVVPLAVVCLWTLTAQERQWRVQESQHLLLTARLAGRLLQEHFERIRRLAQALADQDRFMTDVAQGRRDALQEQLSLLVRATPELEAAEVRDAHGRLLAHTYPLRVSVRGDIPELVPFGEAVSSVFLSHVEGGGKVVAVSQEIFQGPQRIGTLTVHLQLDAIGRWLEKIRVEPEGFVYVADQRGKLVSYPFQAAPGRPKDASDWMPIAATASAAGEVLRFHQGMPATPWTAAVVVVEPFGWRVVAQQPDAATLAPLTRLATVFVALIALLAAMVIALLLRWSRLHRTTLELVAQQVELLRRSEQRHTLSRLRAFSAPGLSHARAAR